MGRHCPSSYRPGLKNHKDSNEIRAESNENLKTRANSLKYRWDSNWKRLRIQ
jgi:hypothetical protein